MHATQAVLPDWLLVAFSGHRRIEDPELVRGGITGALDALAAQGAQLAGMSSIAVGGDTLFLQELDRRGIPYYAILPFEQERFRDTLGATEWDCAAELLGNAITVETVGPTQSAEEGYLHAGIHAVDRSDVLLAVWNGGPSGGTGGTAEIVEYARALGKPLIIVDAVTGTVSQERMQQLQPRTASGEQGAPRELVQRQYERLDAVATDRRPSFLRIILLHLAAEALAVIPLVFAWHGVSKNVFAAAELLLLLMALYLAIRMRHAHSEWISTRMGAELCRSFLALWHLRRRDTRLPRIVTPGMGRLRRSLEMAWYLDRGNASDLEQARSEYIRARIDEQIAYFDRSFRFVAPRFRFLRRAATAGTLFAFLAGGSALILGMLGMEGLTHAWLELGNLLLPLASAALLSLIVSEDFARRSVRYAEMRRVLESARTRLQLARTWYGVTSIAVETEERLLQEVLEWHSISRFAIEPH